MPGMYSLGQLRYVLIQRFSMEGGWSAPADAAFCVESEPMSVLYILLAAGKLHVLTV